MLFSPSCQPPDHPLSHHPSDIIVVCDDRLCGVSVVSGGYRCSSHWQHPIGGAGRLDAQCGNQHVRMGRNQKGLLSRVAYLSYGLCVSLFSTTYAQSPIVVGFSWFMCHLCGVRQGTIEHYLSPHTVFHHYKPSTSSFNLFLRLLFSCLVWYD